MKDFCSKDLILLCEEYVQDRINTLVKDVSHCLIFPRASFPAIIYCFSTINLFGALVKGSVDRGDENERMYYFLREYMQYDYYNSNLLVAIAQHRNLQLGLPAGLVVDNNDQVITWEYFVDEEETGKQHLGIEISHDGEATHCFSICIRSFLYDIRNSALAPNGYLFKVKNNPLLLENFVSAIRQVRQPEFASFF